MRREPPRRGIETTRSGGYARQLANLGSVLATLLILAIGIVSSQRRAASVPTSTRGAGESPSAPRLVVPARAAPEARKPDPPPEEPPSPPVKALDRVAVAKAEATLDEASRDRARAEGRLAEAERSLAAATTEAAAATAANRTLAFRVRDPSAQITRLVTQGGFITAERDRLKEEVAALRRAPRPKPKSLVDRNPVARPAVDEEYHFEIRHNRVTYIDLDRLLKLVKSDAQLRVRLADNSRAIESKVGPVGSFSMEYVLKKSVPLGIEELLERRGISFDLNGWELIPEFEGRGETYETAAQPFSEYARAINRLSVERATITMWVYPDGFPLYRRLRDDLHARGYMVAARPLPEGMPIKGSPAGSISAGQ
jgi:hypothetical protein